MGWPTSYVRCNSLARQYRRRWRGPTKVWHNEPQNEREGLEEKWKQFMTFAIKGGGCLALSVFQILFFFKPYMFCIWFWLFISTEGNPIQHFLLYNAQCVLCSVCFPRKFRPALKVRALPHSHNFETFQHILSAVTLDSALITSQCIV